MPDAAGELAAHYADNRTALILTSILIVGGSALVAAWYVGLAALVGRDPLGRLLGRIGLVGMSIQIAVLMVAFTIFAALAYRDAPRDTALLMTELGWLLVNLAGGPVTTVAILAFAVALKRLGVGGAWLLPLSVFAAIAHLVVAVSFADDGFFSPTGGVEIAVPIIYQAWIGAVAIAMLR
jgi:hypothetical protein